MGTIPMYLDHTLKDRASWNQHFKWRLDPTKPERYPKDWDAARKVWNDPDWPYPRTIWGGSLYGKIRDWMGVEGVSYIVYDDPALFEEMVTTAADCIVGVMTRLFQEGCKVDACSMWEDMCYKAGPLLSPEHFRRYLMPHYRRITELCRKHGCDVIYVDCDGKIDALLPLWFEAGVNCMFPIEVGVWKADVVAYRKQYGKELLIMGGVDKNVLAGPKRGIKKEVERLAPLVEEGGFIPMPDHRVPPNVPLEHYMYYLRQARKVWGKEVNLKPLGRLVKKQAARQEGVVAEP
jgi:uroporphyrinogen decarboxylase